MKVVVAAFPLVSDGGVFTYLRISLRELRRQGVHCRLLWSSRVRSSWPEDEQERTAVSWAASATGLLRSRRALQQALDEPETVLMTALPQADMVAATLPRRLRKRWVMQVHGQPFPQQGEAPWPRRVVWCLLWQLARRRCPRRLYVSDYLRRHLRDPSGGVFRVPVDAGDVRGLPDRTTIGFVGRLSHEKGLDRFIAATNDREEAVVIRGDGPLAALARDAARLRSETVFEGWVDGERRWEGITVLVLPSRREGLSLVTLEAQCRGIPVVAVAVGGVPEAMSPELVRRGGLRSQKDLSAGIEALIAAAGVVDRHAMRRWVLERHSVGPATAALLVELRTALEAS